MRKSILFLFAICIQILIFFVLIISPLSDKEKNLNLRGESRAPGYSVQVISQTPTVTVTGGYAKDNSYIKQVKENTYYGRVLGIVYNTADTTIIKTSESVGDLFFNEELIKTALKDINNKSLDLILVLVSDNGDTSFFTIDECNSNNNLSSLNRNRLQFIRSSPPNILQAVIVFKPDQIIIIPSSESLSKFAKVFINLIYFEGEQIPEITVDQNKIDRLKNF